MWHRYYPELLWLDRPFTLPRLQYLCCGTVTVYNRGQSWWCHFGLDSVQGDGRGIGSGGSLNSLQTCFGRRNNYLCGDEVLAESQHLLT